MRQVIRVLKTPVTLIILLAILGYGAMWGYQQATMPDTRKVATCVMTDVGTKLTPDRVSVRVFNGGTKGGRAKTTGFYLTTYGFHVVRYANSERAVVTTTVIGNAAADPEVLLVAKMFKGALTEGDGRDDHVVDVIVSNENQQFDNPPPMSVAVTGPICLPVLTATSSGSATPAASATPSKSTTPKKK